MEKVKEKHIVGKVKHIRTASGRHFYPFKPSVDDIDIEDIAQSLSLQCRYTGHTRYLGKMKHYSIAQHSLYVSYICDYPLWGLLHDASEVYLVDVPTPIKRRLPEFKVLEDKIEKVISKKFNLEWPRPSRVKDADILAFNIEWPMLMDSSEKLAQIKEYDKFIEMLNYSMEEVKEKFLERFYELQKNDK
jgi:uncharacterized protein